MRKQKIESQESKYDKAQIALLSLLEQVISNLDSNIEKRLDQDKVQNIKKYYFEEYRYFLEFKYLFFSFFISIVLFQIFQINKKLLGSETYLFFGIFAIGVILLRYFYDESRSTKIYILKLLGRFDNENYNSKEIIEYLERKIFFQNEIILYKNYFFLSLFSSFILFFGVYFEEPKSLAIIIFVSIVCLFKKPFTKIVKVKK